MGSLQVVGLFPGQVIPKTIKTVLCTRTVFRVVIEGLDHPGISGHDTVDAYRSPGDDG